MKQRFYHSDDQRIRTVTTPRGREDGESQKEHGEGRDF